MRGWRPSATGVSLQGDSPLSRVKVRPFVRQTQVTMLWYSDRSLPPAYSFVARLNWVTDLPLARLRSSGADQPICRRSASQFQAGSHQAVVRPSRPRRRASAAQAVM